MARGGARVVPAAALLLLLLLAAGGGGGRGVHCLRSSEFLDFIHSLSLSLFHSLVSLSSDDVSG
jgi:hypothetical protein